MVFSLPFTTSSLKYRRLLVVIKQTAFEEYSQLKLRGLAPKALRWSRLESRYNKHKKCVDDLIGILQRHKVEFSCVNRVELDRQHLADVDLVLAVGGDGTVLSSAHFLDHGTIPLLGINSDPITSTTVKGQKTDERRSHGALCACTSDNMAEFVPQVLHGGGNLKQRNRIQCVVKSTFSETRLVPGLNDMLICNPSPAAVSRFRMGWMVHTSDQGLEEMTGVKESSKAYAFSSFQESGLRNTPSSRSDHYGTITRFGGMNFDVIDSLNVWSSGIWICTSTGSTAAMHAAGGMPMDLDSTHLQYLVREHIMEQSDEGTMESFNNRMVEEDQQIHLRWNSNYGRIYIDGSHLTHDLELGDEILINNKAPILQLYVRHSDPDSTDSAEKQGWS